MRRRSVGVGKVGRGCDARQHVRARGREETSVRVTTGGGDGRRRGRRTRARRPRGHGRVTNLTHGGDLRLLPFGVSRVSVQSAERLARKHASGSKKVGDSLRTKSVWLCSGQHAGIVKMHSKWTRSCHIPCVEKCLKVIKTRCKRGRQHSQSRSRARGERSGR